jgi:NADPH-dependent ferric siderophore reductase
MRTTTVAFGQVDPRGPMHVTVGAGGRKCEAPFKNEEPEPWLEVRDATVYGYGMFRIANHTHAEWDWVHTGHNEKREYNQLYHSNATLPAGPGRDRVLLTNQFYL